MTRGLQTPSVKFALFRRSTVPLLLCVFPKITNGSDLSETGIRRKDNSDDVRAKRKLDGYVVAKESAGVEVARKKRAGMLISSLTEPNSACTEELLSSPAFDVDRHTINQILVTSNELPFQDNPMGMPSNQPVAHMRPKDTRAEYADMALSANAHDTSITVSSSLERAIKTVQVASAPSTSGGKDVGQARCSSPVITTHPIDDVTKHYLQLLDDMKSTFSGSRLCSAELPNLNFVPEAQRSLLKHYFKWKHGLTRPRLGAATAAELSRMVDMRYFPKKCKGFMRFVSHVARIIWSPESKLTETKVADIVNFSKLYPTEAAEDIFVMTSADREKGWDSLRDLVIKGECKLSLLRLVLNQRDQVNNSTEERVRRRILRRPDSLVTVLVMAAFMYSKLTPNQVMALNADEDEADKYAWSCHTVKSLRLTAASQEQEPFEESDHANLIRRLQVVENCLLRRVTAKSWMARLGAFGLLQEAKTPMEAHLHKLASLFAASVQGQSRKAVFTAILRKDTEYWDRMMAQVDEVYSKWCDQSPNNRTFSDWALSLSPSQSVWVQCSNCLEVIQSSDFPQSFLAFAEATHVSPCSAQPPSMSSAETELTQAQSVPTALSSPLEQSAELAISSEDRIQAVISELDNAKKMWPAPRSLLVAMGEGSTAQSLSFETIPINFSPQVLTDFVKWRFKVCSRKLRAPVKTVMNALSQSNFSRRGFMRFLGHVSHIMWETPKFICLPRILDILHFAEMYPTPDGQSIFAINTDDFDYTHKTWTNLMDLVRSGECEPRLIEMALALPNTHTKDSIRAHSRYLMSIILMAAHMYTKLSQEQVDALHGAKDVANMFQWSTPGVEFQNKEPVIIKALPPSVICKALVPPGAKGGDDAAWVRSILKSAIRDSRSSALCSEFCVEFLARLTAFWVLEAHSPHEAHILNLARMLASDYVKPQGLDVAADYWKFVGGVIKERGLTLRSAPSEEYWRKCARIRSWAEQLIRSEHCDIFRSFLAIAESTEPRGVDSSRTSLSQMHFLDSKLQPESSKLIVSTPRQRVEGKPSKSAALTQLTASLFVDPVVSWSAKTSTPFSLATRLNCQRCETAGPPRHKQNLMSRLTFHPTPELLEVLSEHDHWRSQVCLQALKPPVRGYLNFFQRGALIKGSKGFMRFVGHLSRVMWPTNERMTNGRAAAITELADLYRLRDGRNLYEAESTGGWDALITLLEKEPACRQAIHVAVDQHERVLAVAKHSRNNRRAQPLLGFLLGAADIYTQLDPKSIAALNTEEDEIWKSDGEKTLSRMAFVDPVTTHTPPDLDIPEEVRQAFLTAGGVEALGQTLASAKKQITEAGLVWPTGELAEFAYALSAFRLFEEPTSVENHVIKLCELINVKSLPASTEMIETDLGHWYLIWRYLKKKIDQPADSTEMVKTVNAPLSLVLTDCPSPAFSAHCSRLLKWLECANVSTRPRRLEMMLALAEQVYPWSHLIPTNEGG